MEKTVIAIRHVAFEDLGVWDEGLRARGFAIEVLDAGVDDLDPITSTDPDLLILLGGPISVNEVERYPFLLDELRLVRDRLERRRPTIGICLGAQLIAQALGAAVRAGPAPEIGLMPIALTADGQTSCLSAFATTPVLHWHGESFDLPAGAVRLASTPTCANQAFAVARHVLAVQFHPEAGDTRFERWLIGHTVELAAAGIDVAVLREDYRCQRGALAVAAQACLAGWLDGLGL